MPSAKAKASTPRITVRDLGVGAKKGLGKEALKKVRGGQSESEAIAASDYDARKKPKPGPCVYGGERCSKIHFHIESAKSLLTVVISTSA